MKTRGDGHAASRIEVGEDGEPIEVLEHGNALAGLVDLSAEPGIDLEAIARAEQALDALADRFDGWLEEESGALAEAATRYVGAADPAALPVVFRAAHNLKGDADTFGYPLVRRVASSLCALIEGLPDGQRPAAGLVRGHVEAIGAMVRQRAKGADHPLGRAIAEELENAVAKALAA